MRLWQRLACAGLILLAAVLMVVYQTASQLLSSTIERQLQARGDELARPLSASLVAPLLQQDFATVQAVLDDVASAGHIKALTLRDDAGRRIASSGGATGLAPPPLGVPYVDRAGGLCMDFQVRLEAGGQRLGDLRFALSAQALVESLSALRLRLLQISGLALLVLGVLVVLGSRWLTAPLQRLTEAARRIGHGEYDTELPRPGRDEIGQLSTSLAVLRDAIRSRLAQLHQARDAAESANRAKSAFLANTSHEIRTPLNGVLGMARLARQPGLDPQRRQQYLDLLTESANALAEIVTDTLDLAKIEAGKLVLEQRAFDPRALLESMVTSYRPIADAAGLVIGVQIDPAVPHTVMGDQLRVRQIVNNYLTNALKFTDQGSVQIVLQALPDQMLRLAVCDTGPGVSAGMQSKLFAPFTQGDDSATRRHGGTGLGLAICRELAERMGGQTGVDSHPGQGSAFWATMKLPAAAQQPDPHLLRLDSTEALHGKRALIVEDNPVNRVLAMSLLEGWGMAVKEAENGQEAVHLVQQADQLGRPFDLVLMDLQMPVMDGHTATRQLRARYTADTLPIIALTAAALPAERMRAMESGMNDFLTKPIEPSKLLAVLNLQFVNQRDRPEARSAA